MSGRMEMRFWKGESFWVGSLVDHPDIMSPGETIEELQENLRDAARLMQVFADESRPRC